VRWCGDFQHSPVPAPEDFCPFSDDIEIRQYAAAIHEELLAFCGQDEAPAYVVK